MTLRPKIPTVDASLLDHEERLQALEANPAGGGALDWADIPLLNGWTAGFVTPQYALDSAGLVHLRGYGDPGLFNDALGQLPAGFRPSSYQTVKPAAFNQSVQVEIDDGDGSIYVFDYKSEGIGTGFQKPSPLIDGGGTYPSGFTFGVKVGAATTLADIAYTPYLISGNNAGGDLIAITSGGDSGFGALSTGYAYGIFGIQRYFPAMSDQQADLTIFDAASLDFAQVACRVQMPFVANPVPIPPWGVYGQVEPTPGGAMDIFLGNGLGETPPTSIAGGVSPGLNDGDVLSLVAIGRMASFWINGVLQLFAFTDDIPAAGQTGFGFSPNTGSTIVVTDFTTRWPEDDKHLTNEEISLDGIVFEAAV